jgi:glutamine amidotransferase
MSGLIGIIDYGMGNLHSVKNAFDYIGSRSVITSDKTELENCTALVLPGVGAFGDAMHNLERNDMIDFIKKQASLKPFLGICLGMQLLFDRSYEFKETEGLGLISGEVIRLTSAENDRTYKIPHMGWNSITTYGSSPLLRNVTSGSYVYFVHSFKGVTADRGDVCAYTEYGEQITAAVDNP